jgi:outer membrane protein assembly factor BamE (lipoprotein component of BamABCDE complex)
MKNTFIPISLATVLLTGCVGNVPYALLPARQADTQKVTLGNVQSQVQPGASSADVITALGSPNIITTNNDKTETWVYDKVMSETEVARDYYGGVKARSSRTMIVTVKFNKSKKVEDVQYRQTSY